MSELSTLYKTWDFEHHFEGEPEPRKWELGRPKLSTHAAYSRRLFAKVSSRIESTREELGDAVVDRMHLAWASSAVEDSCGWKSKEFWASLHSPDNCKELFWIWLLEYETKKPSRERLTRKQFDSMWEDRSVDCCSIMREMVNDKNPTHAPA